MFRSKPFNLFYRMLSTKLFNHCRGSIFHSILKLKLLGLLYTRKPYNILAVPALFQISFLSKAKKDEDNLATSLLVADKHYNDTKYEEADSVLTTLKETDYSKNDEVLWRLARVKYELSKEVPSEKKYELMQEAFKYVNEALQINPRNGYAHKWFAILTDSTASSKSIRERIDMALLTKEHLLQALKYIPQDGTSHYILGLWHFSFADFSWYERKIASALNSKFPTTSYQQALEYFLRAEEVEPNFYSRNYLLLGKCFMRLQEKDKAIEFLVKARDYPKKTTEDNDTHKEALMLLQKLGVK